MLQLEHSEVWRYEFDDGNVIYADYDIIEMDATGVQYFFSIYGPNGEELNGIDPAVKEEDIRVGLFPAGIIHKEGFLHDYRVYSDGEFDLDQTADMVTSHGIFPQLVTLEWLEDGYNNDFFSIVDQDEAEEIIGCDGCPCCDCLDEEQPQEKPDVVQVIRYLRQYTDRGDIDNMTGMTIVADLDYKHDTINIYWSDCQGDNFNKQLGFDIAVYGINSLEPKLPIKFPMNGGISPNGLIFDVMDFLVEHEEQLPKRYKELLNHMRKYL